MLSPILSDSALRYALYACAASSLICWAASVVTRNYSQVDRLWSLLPALYVGGFAAAASFRDPRLDLMALLVAAWGARLTYNFARKGGYTRGHEDYRWSVLRARMSPAAFQLFNASFIAPYQNLLLLLIALPAWAALRAGGPLGWLDGLAAAGFVLSLLGEAAADLQQWRFHQDKHARRARGEAVTQEFLTDGLFRYSRHPNFFCEMAMWWCIYLFSVAAGAGWLNLSIIGPLLLTLLFQGSTAMTEGITRSKYPSYAEYQRRTSRFWPRPP